MKRTNPLFVDSTRTQGEDIATQIELLHIPPYLGEEIYVKVVDKAGKEQVSVLERRNEGLVSGYVLLKHQQEIKFQFFVARSGKPVFMSQPFHTRATYLISENWKPLPVDESLCTFLKDEDVTKGFFGPPQDDLEEIKEEAPTPELVADTLEHTSPVIEEVMEHAEPAPSVASEIVASQETAPEAPAPVEFPAEPAVEAVAMPETVSEEPLEPKEAMFSNSPRLVGDPLLLPPGPVHTSEFEPDPVI